jgi:hypothetical protein
MEEPMTPIDQWREKVEQTIDDALTPLLRKINQEKTPAWRTLRSLMIKRLSDETADLIMEAIGEDETNNFHGASYRNALRAELREYFKGMKGGDAK